MATEFNREYLLRLPLPLAQLYSRAYNAKDARSRHDNAFYLFEALIKLGAAPLVAAYLEEVARGAPRHEPVDRLLVQLALPSLGQWMAIFRFLASHFGRRADASSHALGHLWSQLDTQRRDLPGILALYRRIKNGPDGQEAGDQSTSLVGLLDALVQYRNGVFGHGAGRFDSFYEQEMGPLLFPALNEILRADVLSLLGPAGTRLVYLSELRVHDERRHEISLRELVGLQAERMDPRELNAQQAQRVAAHTTAVLWPGQAVPLRLDPLLVYRENEQGEEVLFLNRDRNGRQVELLSYTTGRTERDASLAPAMRRLLSRITGRDVEESELARLAESDAEESSACETLLEKAARPRRTVGDYEILAEIGRGGMGVVYLARQLSLGRIVALKMLPADLAGDEVALARFRREMRALARCDHPNIIKVLASGSLHDGQLYYAMEYVAGADLEQVWRELAGPNRRGEAKALGGTTWGHAVLSASRKLRDNVERMASNLTTSGVRRDATRVDREPPLATSSRPSTAAAENPRPEPLPLPPLPPVLEVEDDPGGYERRVAYLLRDVALAVQAVHDQGIVHRDIKPANLILTSDGSRVVLMDFGLAKGQSLQLSASRSAGFLGTLRYAAPEQLASAQLNVGPRADVRALGVTLWELLTRERAFGDAEDEGQLAARVLTKDLPLLRQVERSLDADLEAIVARATDRDVDRRIQSARQFADYLQLFLDGKPLPIRPPGVIELVRRRMRDNKALVATISAASVMLILTIGVFAWWSARSLRRAKALELVNTIQNAELDRAVDLIHGELPNVREIVTPRFVELANQPDLEPDQKLRVRLALADSDQRQAKYVLEAMFKASPEDALILCDALSAHRQLLVGRSWELLKNPATDGRTALVAAVAVARYDATNPAWPTVANLVAREMTLDNPIYLKSWLDGLRPIRQVLIGSLADVCRETAVERSAARLLAANVLADYAADGKHLNVLADLVLDGDKTTLAIFLPKLQARRASAVAALTSELRADLPSDASPQDRDRAAKRKAKAAATLARLGEWEPLFALLQFHPESLAMDRRDPSARSYLIHILEPWGADPQSLVRRYLSETDLSARRALLLALGQFKPDLLPDADREKLQVALLTAFQNDPDPGLHSAAHWLLDHWGLAEQARTLLDPVVPGRITPPKRWFIGAGGHTLVVIDGPVDFMMGSPTTEQGRQTNVAQPQETLHAQRIPRRYAIATMAVTVQQFQEFLATHPPGVKHSYWTDYAPYPNCAQTAATWYEAAAYCRWLSEQENMPESQMCFPPIAEIQPGVTLRADCLERTGYRLPTEAEWEYACRALTSTARHYGETEELLREYGLYEKNTHRHTEPSLLFKPNEFGLFDMLGNGWDWCLDTSRPYEIRTDGQPAIEVMDPTPVNSLPERVLRGGGISTRPEECRSAVRFRQKADSRLDYVTFRVARTLE